MEDAYVASVVVTYNRRDLLTEALLAIGAQTRPPDAVIVVDNASSDGTARLLRERFPSVDLVVLPRNTGGRRRVRGGHRACPGTGATALWLMDDDTVPSPGALAALLSAFGRHPPRARGQPGRVDRRPRPPDEHPAPTAAPESPGTPVSGPRRSCPCCSTPRAVRETGLPVADYFLWNDDFEYTLRLLRGRLGLVCPASVVVHRTASPDFDPGARFFYEVRNKVWLFTRSRCLAPGERLVYAGASLRRWARAFAGSRDRTGLVRELGRGLWAGLRAGPRPNAVVLAGARGARRAYWHGFCSTLISPVTFGNLRGHLGSLR